MKPRRFFRSRTPLGLITIGTPVVLGFAFFISGLGTADGGDILRGGGGVSTGAPESGGTTSGTTTPADTSQARINAQDALARNTNALNAVRAMQDAARAAAQTGPNNLGNGLPDVTNGLGTGGLQVAPGVGTDPTKWQGAELPTQTTNTQGLVDVSIRQTAQQALLQWQTFNVGKKTTLTFDQSAAGSNAKQWIAFNQITDPTGNPTQILGQIKAQGQVYVINPNGVIFGGSSQVNVNTLTVSSLPINTNLLERGLLNNPDAQFLFSGINLPAGPNGTPAFTPTPPPSSTGRYGDVIIQAGAQITTPVSADGNGGRVALFGPNVTNSGTILTPAGQTIMASGLQIGLAAHDSSDPSLRGLDVFVGQVGSYAGTSTNTGLISAPRGAITIAGKNISSTGVLSSTTSVSLNGRIDLLAHYGALSNPTTGSSINSVAFLNRSSGNVTIGDGSAIGILPEYNSTETTIGTTLALRSQINIQGLSVHLGENSSILAPNALVNLSAGEWYYLGGIFPTSTFTQSAGQVYIDRNALVNVAGSIDVPVSVSQNIISVDLRGAELANSPLQRNGPLRGQSVQIDIRDAGIYESALWLGTPLADVAGFANLIQRGVGQLTTAGGSVNISAGQSTVMQAGAKVDVSGGSIAYTEAVVRTSQLITPGGVLVDISNARPDVVYLGIYDSIFDASNVKFGTTELYAGSIVPGGGRVESGYLQGAAGGALSITSPAMALDATLLGKTFTGEFQRATLPLPSTLTLAFTARDRTYVSLPNFAPTPPAVIFSNGIQTAADPFQVDASGVPQQLRADRLAEVIISPDLLIAGGFTNFTLNNPDGSITIAEGTIVKGLDSGSVTMIASNITVNGSIIAPNGNLIFKSPNLPLSTLNFIANNTLGQAPAPVAARGRFILGPNATISAAGRLVDDRVSIPEAGSDPVVMGGGNVSISAFEAQFLTGGIVDVSGGARADAKGKISYGGAGSLKISAGQDTGIPSVAGGSISLGAEFLGYSGTNAGGSLAISAPAIRVGGTSSEAGVLSIDPSLFNRGGFSAFSLSGTGLSSGTAGVTVSSGTSVRPIVSTRLATASDGQPLRFSDPATLSEGVRATANLTFLSGGLTDPFSNQIITRGDVLMEAGSSIETDARSNISFIGKTVTIRGSILTPGGSIIISGANSYPSTATSPLLSTVLIGTEARLSATGKTVLIPHPLGLRSGEVLSGGTISVSGNIVAQRGAILDVTGATGILDLPPTAAGLISVSPNSTTGRLYVPVTIDSNGGTINLSGAAMLHTDATLTGAAGGSSATGGKLNISSSRYVPINTTSTTADINLVVKQDGFNIAAPNGTEIVGTLPKDLSGNNLPGLGMISVSSFEQGGFDSLTLGGNIRFNGDVSITMPGSIRAATGGVIEATGNVTMNAPNISIGQAFRPPAQVGEVIDLFIRTIPGQGDLRYNFAPTNGTGTITANARLIDIGTLSLQNIGTGNFNAPTGDIRGNGTLQAAANLTFNAGQVNPTTASPFNIFAYDQGSVNGSVTFTSAAPRPLPLSGGGTLSVYASVITQGGNLHAPLGVINLGYNGSGTAPENLIAGTTRSAPVTSNLTLTPGSVTSVSAIDPISGKALSIPYGISFDGNSWIDPSGLDITVTGPPAKRVNLSALTLESDSGSLIDISGGGDLYAYRWIQGNGGRSDVLASTTSFAVIPDYGFDYSPYGAFNAQAPALQGNPGYTNSSLKAGDKITIGTGSALPAGTYTLLPARYALLPGAFLVTPEAGTTISNARQPDGATIVAGYRSNSLDVARSGPTRITNFEIAPYATVRTRSQYQDLSANTFLRDAALSRNLTTPRLPGDAGFLAYTATNAITLNGGVKSVFSNTSRGALIDINSPVDILINSSGTGGAVGQLVLSTSLLNSFGAESLLIGGTRNNGTNVSVSTTNLTLDNVGSPLIGTDIILAANGSITLANGAAITSTGTGASDNLVLGSSAVAGSGNGALVRVSASPGTSVTRLGVIPGSGASLSIGASTLLSGGSLSLDSTASTNLNASANLAASSVFLSSGEVSLALANAGTLNPTTGLVLSGDALASLQASASSLSLRSYSALNIYGTGQVGSPDFQQLSLQAVTMRGYNQNAGTATFSAKNLVIGNPGAIAPGAASLPLGGTLLFDADRITLADGNVLADGFSNVAFNGTTAVTISGSGSFRSAGATAITTNSLNGLQASTYTIAANGNLTLNPSATPGTAEQGGLGANLTLEGAALAINGNISLPSGQLNLRAISGDLLIGNTSPAMLDLGGTSKQFVDVTRYTSGGIIRLSSLNGSVKILPDATLSVAAKPGGANAGRIEVFAPNGRLELDGTITASAGIAGTKGEFTLDAATLSSASLANLDAILNAGQFTALRDYRIRTGDILIDGSATSSVYRASADTGNITVTGSINASGMRGGDIDLKANGSLTLASGSMLNASAQSFDAAGKGGSVTLEAGSQRNGIVRTDAFLNLSTGSTISLGVAENDASSASLGKFSGTLHLRAPRNASNTDLQLAAIGSTITGASAITVEGYRLYDLTGTSNGTITSAVQTQIRNDANAYLGSAGTTTAGYSAMLSRLKSSNPSLDLILTPGAEIINRTGDLTLGTTSSTATSDWNLSTFRFGPRSAAGTLTLRASQNLAFYNALSDGFSGGSSLWLAPLMANNPLLPANSQSWSYHLTAGADTSAASYRNVIPISALAANAGGLNLGKNAGAASVTGAANALTSSFITNYFQVIRTGSGDIDINAGRSVQLRNVFASIYTAGTQVLDPTGIFSANDFVSPILTANVNNGSLGNAQQSYGAYYSMAGGDISITASENIDRKTVNNGGLIDDSSRQLPNNWLNRRGILAEDGTFSQIRIPSGFSGIFDSAASTSWWVNFSNFFQSVGALGGGNITLTAGIDVKNTDAAIPTNARAPRGIPDPAALIELGGGDLKVTAGRNVDGGVYYLESGNGTITAGGKVTTNSTRSPSLGLIQNLNNPTTGILDPLTWLPTTLFAGKSTFDVTAASDIILSPVTNPFLLPQGVTNRFWYKTYFNTFSEDAGVRVTSLGGNITLRNSIIATDANAATPILRNWNQTQLIFRNSIASTSFVQPWLRLNETDISPFDALWSLAAPSLQVSSLSGGISVVGNITLFPSAKGQLELIAAKSIQGFNPAGISNSIIPGQSTRVWTGSTINFSDADPNSIPQPLKPFTNLTYGSSGAVPNASTQLGFLSFLTNALTESGSLTGTNAVLQTKQARHAAVPIHIADPEPARITGLDGDVSGFTLFSPKRTNLLASGDITDVSLYIQNLASSDISVISAGRDIVAYNSSSPSRVASKLTGNLPGTASGPNAGDIQISGPGSLEVLAGRNLDLGLGSANADGTGSGITSIGNFRNPALPSQGSDLLVAAGLTGLAGNGLAVLDFDTFISSYVTTAEGLNIIGEISPGIDFTALDEEHQRELAIAVFYRLLRDTGRNFNNPNSPGYRNYDTAFEAITALFGEEAARLWNGEILARGRDIRTRSGGDISILAPGGGLALANTTIGNPLAPPGIITEAGGSISIFTDGSVDIGIGRIFTLRGGDAVIFSSTGDIAAGSSSRTVQAAPPTRVVIDPQSASVQTDLAGLATGGGIGVLATVVGVAPGDVDLVAPTGIIDAGDAGIRVSGNINLAAVQVVNAGNISAGGTSSGGGASVSAPSVATITAGSTSAATTTAATPGPEKDPNREIPKEITTELSIFDVVVIGYGGGEARDEDEDRIKDKADEEEEEAEDEL